MTYDLGPGNASGDPALVVVEVIEREGPMGLKVAAVQQPAVGADFSWQGPTDRPFRVAVVSAELVTSGVAANRLVALQIKNRNGNILGEWAVSVPQTATKTTQWTWSSEASPPTTLETVMNIGLPQQWWPDGCTISSVTAAIDVGDQWSNVVVSYHVEEEY